MEEHNGPRALTLAAVGDIILAHELVTLDNPVFNKVRAADIATGNLEFVLTKRREAGDKLIALRADPALAHRLAATGIAVLTLANNHAMDFGAAGLADSLARVRDAGMAPVGAGSALDESLLPHVRDVNGVRVAFFGVSTHLPNGSAAGPSRSGIAPVRVRNSYMLDPVTLAEVPGMAPFVATEVVADDRDRLCAAIGNAAAHCDLVIVNIHWGVPLGWVATHQDEIADYQRPLAHALVEAGAAAIVGHGPHVVQPVEFYRGAPILYSIGNFVMHDILPATAASASAYPAYRWESLRSEWNAIGCIARLQWDGDRTLAACELVITQLDAHGEPHPGTRMNTERLAARLAAGRGSAGTVKRDGAYWLLSYTDRG